MAKTEEELKQLEEQINTLLTKLETLGVSIDIQNIDKLNVGLESANEKLMSNLTLNQKQLEQASEALDAQIQLNDAAFRAGKITKEQYGDNQKRLGQEQKKVDLLSEEEKTAKNTLKTTLGITDNSGVYGKKLEEINRISKLNLSQEERKELALRLQAKVIDGMAQAAQFLFNQALKIDDTARNLMKTAGFTFEDASRGIMNAGLDAAAAGVPIEKLGAAMATLKTTFTGYTELTEKQRDGLNSLVATMDNMGLSAATQSKFMDTATKSMGMSIGQTTNFISSLKGFSDQSGISLQELDKNLAGSTTKLANFGRDGVKVFKEMSLASKQLGIDMGALFDVVERFTTFEGAAEAAGKFNALLGGPFLNSVDLLTMSMENPVESFKLFKNAMDQSGKSFDDMDNGMKRTVAAALGMSVEQAGKLFAQDINTATRAMREQAATQEKLNELSGKMTNLQDKFKAALAALYPVLEPIVNGIAAVSDKITEFAVSFGEYMKESPNLVAALKGIAAVLFFIGAAAATVGAVILPFITTLMSLRAVYAGLQIIKSPLMFITKGLAAAKAEEAAATQADTAAKTANIPATKAAGGAAGTAAVGMLKMGAAILLIGVGIGIAAYGLSFLVASFKDLGDAAWPAAAAIVGFTLSLGGLVAILAAISSGPQAIVIGAAVILLLGIGAAAMMIGKGIEMAATSLTGFLNVITEDKLTQFDALNEKFKTLAGHIKDIKNADVLKDLTKLTTSGPAKQSTAVPTLEFAVASGRGAGSAEAGKTSVAGGGNKIELHLKIDSPIMLENREIGRFVDNKIETILTSLRIPQMSSI